jgi:hypothetical protein
MSIRLKTFAYSAASGSGDCPSGLTVCFKSIVVSKPQMCFRLKTQSPSPLEWRLRVEVGHACRFETTVKSGTPLSLMDSRRYRVATC